MTFISLTSQSRRHGRRTQVHHVTATQKRRPDSGALELVMRFSRELMEYTGFQPGQRADILHDLTTQRWKVKRVAKGGLCLSGQKNRAGYYSSCSLSITLQPGVPTISNDTTNRIRRFSLDSETVVEEGEVTFFLSEPEYVAGETISLL